MAGATKTAKITTPKDPASKGFSEEERAAMKAAIKEYRGARSSKHTAADDLAGVMAAIAEMPEHDRLLAERIHALVLAAAPSLAPRTWYGSPAYYKDGRLICFFQPAAKFKTRYANFGFMQDAKLDEGAMWPTSFAITTLTPADEERIAELVKRAVG